jgi:hypothetical protein
MVLVCCRHHVLQVRAVLSVDVVQHGTKELENVLDVHVVGTRHRAQCWTLFVDAEARRTQILSRTRLRYACMLVGVGWGSRRCQKSKIHSRCCSNAMIFLMRAAMSAAAMSLPCRCAAMFLPCRCAVACCDCSVAVASFSWSSLFLGLVEVTLRMRVQEKYGAIMVRTFLNRTLNVQIDRPSEWDRTC